MFLPTILLVLLNFVALSDLELTIFAMLFLGRMYTLAQKFQNFMAVKIKNQKFATKAAQNYSLGAVP